MFYHLYPFFPSPGRGKQPKPQPHLRLLEALMEIALVLVIVGIMIAMTHDLGSILTVTMVRPLVPRA